MNMSPVPVPQTSCLCSSGSFDFCRLPLGSRRAFRR